MIPRKMITLGDDVLEGVSGGYDDRHVGEWICCGFGVGLSWGTAAFETNNIVCPEVIQYVNDV